MANTVMNTLIEMYITKAEEFCAPAHLAELRALSAMVQGCFAAGAPKRVMDSGLTNTGRSYFTISVRNAGCAVVEGQAGVAEALGLKASTCASRLSNAGGKWHFTRTDPETGNPSIEITVERGVQGDHDENVLKLLHGTRAVKPGRPAARVAAPVVDEQRLAAQRAFMAAHPNTNKMRALEEFRRSYDNVND